MEQVTIGGCYKTALTGDDSSMEAGPQISHVLGRPSVVGSEEGPPGPQGGTGGGTSGGSRFHGKPGKITIIPVTGDIQHCQ